LIEINRSPASPVIVDNANNAQEAFERTPVREAETSFMWRT
jgi:hypothetical protein